MKHSIKSVRKVVANGREMFVFELNGQSLPLFVSADYIQRKLKGIGMPESLLLSTPSSFEIDGVIELRKAGSTYTDSEGNERERQSDSLNLQSGAQLTLSQQGQMFAFMAAQMTANLGTTNTVPSSNSNSSEQVETPEDEGVTEQEIIVED